MALSKGIPLEPEVWEELYWAYTTRAAHAGCSLAVRKLRADGQWYVTRGYTENTQILHGPYPSKEAVEMLLEMGALEL